MRRMRVPLWKLLALVAACAVLFTAWRLAISWSEWAAYKTAFAD